MTRNNVARILKVLITAVLLTGCTNNNREAGEGTLKEKNSSEEKGTVTGDVGKENSRSVEKEPSVKGMEREEGRFIGMIDSTSAEVEVDGEIRVFRLSEAVNEKARQLEEGTVIQFFYSEGKNGEQVIEEFQ